MITCVKYIVAKNNITYWLSAGPTEGAKVAATLSWSRTQTGLGLVGRHVNFGAGVPAGPFPVNVAGGDGFTFLLYNFNKRNLK